VCHDGDVFLRALALLGVGWVMVASLQLFLWRISLRTRNAAVVDVGWAYAFTLVIAVFIIAGPAPASSWAPIAAVVVTWSLRLGTHLVDRGGATGPEEGRYRELRQRWAPRPDRAFLIFFQAQALLVAVLSIGFVLPFVGEPVLGWPLRLVGLLIAVTGVIGEAVADRQLARFRADPAHRAQVCDVGLWAYSRHPNYFFESLVWIGYAIYSLAYEWGPFAALAPAIMLFSILRITGIPPTEAQAIRSRGVRYRAYQARVSAFVPWPPKPRVDEHATR
jgi:steroid 5-alpha reductase family enzyme